MKAKLIEKNYLKRLTLDWDSNAETDVEAEVLESLQPHRNLQRLCISGHGGLSCPTWLGDELTVEALQSLHLVGVSWGVLPSLGKTLDLRTLILKHIATIKEFVIEQSFCRLIRLKLVGLGNFEKWVPPQDAHIFPLLQVLIIEECPKLLELPSSNHVVYPAEQDRNLDWFPKLQYLEIKWCPELLLVTHIPWTKTLCYVNITDVKLLEKFEYSKSSYGVELKITGNDDLHSLDQVLASNILTELEKLTLENCPPLELKQLLMLTSLKTLIAKKSPDGLVGPLEGQDDVEWQLPVEHLEVRNSTERELTELLTHLPRLSKLAIVDRENPTEVEEDETASEMEEDEIASAAVAELTVEQKKEEDGVLLFPAHLSDTLRELLILSCPDLVLVAPPTLLPGDSQGGGLQALRALETLKIWRWRCPKLLSFSSSSRLFPSSLQYLHLDEVEGMGTLEPLSNLTSLTRLEIRRCGEDLSQLEVSGFSSLSCRLFPSSLQDLYLCGVEGMGTLKPLSNLTSLIRLDMWRCGEDLRCEGLLPLLTTGGHLSELRVYDTPRFFAGWDPRSEVLQVEGGGEEHQLQLVSSPSSSTLQELSTDDAAGLLAAPICSLLSSSLTKLCLYRIKEMEQPIERFTMEQADALHLLTSLKELQFVNCGRLQHLPAGLHKLTNLKRLEVRLCPAVRPLPNDGFPKSLQELHVHNCNEELKQQCVGLVGTIPKIILD